MISGDVAELQVEQAVGLLRSAAVAMRSVTCSVTDEARAVQAAINALQVHQADLLAEIHEVKAHEADGAASVGTWAARELGQDPAAKSTTSPTGPRAAEPTWPTPQVVNTPVLVPRKQLNPEPASE